MATQTLKIAPLTSSGEIAEYVDVDQFIPGFSAYECGYFAVSIFWNSVPVGKKPTLDNATMRAMAESWYKSDHGDNSFRNTDGMSLEQLHNLLARCRFDYQDVTQDWNLMRDYLKYGYPLFLAIHENSVHDIELGGPVPYPWQPTGNHIILATGFKGNDTVLCRDSANIEKGNILRRGPREYSASKLALVNVVAGIPTWLPTPDVQALKKNNLGNSGGTTIPTQATQNSSTEILTPTDVDKLIWNMDGQNIPLNWHSAIGQDWLVKLNKEKIFKGCPMGKEFQNGEQTWQVFTGGLAIWQPGKTVIWLPTF